ncbi:MAG: hypothetical protein IJV18_03090 [Acidaminococcaceae bacterium]|nr:hypothetical protein [Acidaminococcaceae bacterium]
MVIGMYVEVLLPFDLEYIQGAVDLARGVGADVVARRRSGVCPWGSMNSAPNSSSPLIPFFSILFIGKPPCNYEIVLRKAGSAPFHYRVQAALTFS